MQLTSFLYFTTTLLTLSSAISIDCSSDTDCQSRFEFCNSDKQCQHKQLLPLLPEQIVSPFVLMIGVCLSNASGVGGGAISLPTLLLLLNFRHQEAVALANFIMFIGAVARYITGDKARDSTRPHHTVIQYDFVIILIPMALFGTLLGVYINQTFPQAILLIFLFFLLAFVLYNTLKKGLKIRRKEVEREKKVKVRDNNNGNNSKNQIREVNQSNQQIAPNQLNQNREQSRQLNQIKVKQNNQSNHLQQPSQTPLSTTLNPTLKQKLQKLLKNESSHWQWKKLFLIWGNFFSMVIISLLRGTRGTSIINLEQCSALDWVLQLILLIICLIFVFIASKILIHQNNIKRQANYPIDTQWTSKTIFRFSLFSILIGIIAGSLGLGGGVIITPMILSTNKTPTVASATSLYIIMYTSTSIWIQLLLSKTLNIYYGLFEGGFIFIGALLGLWVIRRLVEKSGKESFLVFLLFSVTAVAMVLIYVFRGMRLARESDDGENIWRFSSPC